MEEMYWEWTCLLLMNYDQLQWDQDQQGIALLSGNYL